MANTWIEIELDTLKENLRLLRARLSPSSDIVLVVKADAYGHGMRDVARAARREGVSRFAVIHIDEAVALREAVPDAEILLLGALDPACVADAVRLHFVCVVVSSRHARALSREAAAAGLTLRCHPKVDTGMGRLGVGWEDAADEIVEWARLPGLSLEGVCTHFASAESDDGAFARLQAQRFVDVVGACEKRGVMLPFRHAANSGAVQQGGHWDFAGVRPGILVYGYPPAPGQRPVPTRPFLQWKTRVLQIKSVPAGFPVSYDSTYTTPAPTRLATINVGYADGFPRALSNRGAVLVGGRSCAVVGRVTMNLTVVDLGPDTAVSEGDEAVLIGTQGTQSVWADDLARWCDTIPYEILTNIRTSDRRVRGRDNQTEG